MLELVADPATRTALDPALAVGARFDRQAPENGFIIRSFTIRSMGDAIGMCPPLIIDAAGVDEILDLFVRTLSATGAGLPAQRQVAE